MVQEHQFILFGLQFAPKEMVVGQDQKMNSHNDPLSGKKWIMLFACGNALSSFKQKTCWPLASYIFLLQLQGELVVQKIQKHTYFATEDKKLLLSKTTASLRWAQGFHGQILFVKLEVLT